MFATTVAAGRTAARRTMVATVVAARRTMVATTVAAGRVMIAVQFGGDDDLHARRVGRLLGQEALNGPILIQQRLETSVDLCASGRDEDLVSARLCDCAASNCMRV